MVFTTKEQFDSFIRNTSKQIGWNNRREFENALREANVDFTGEALVLLRHDEPSGSVPVEFDAPTLQDKKLVLKIRGKSVTGGTADMASYCFAVAVSKSAVNQVELHAVEGGFRERTLPPIVFQIVSNEPSNKSLDASGGGVFCIKPGAAKVE
jgi:hypothetical protein